MRKRLVQGHTCKCSGWDWIRDLPSKVQLRNHCDTETQIW